MATETAETKAKTRRKIPYQVEVQQPDGSWKPEEREIAGWTTACESTTEGERWIKKNGIAGKCYRVAHVTFGPRVVKSVTKTTLVLE